ncbi:aminopeptidase P N-terminal domain-containing protein [soil metagenome]
MSKSLRRAAHLTTTKSQPADHSASTPPIPRAEYMHRRERILKALGPSAAIVLSGTQEGDKFEADASFDYLTGITTEAGAAVLFDPGHEDPKRRIVLFLKPLMPEVDRWEGLREELSANLRERLGFRTILRTSALPMWLTVAARRSKSLACLHPFATYPAAPSEDLKTYKLVAERIPGVAILDRTDLLAAMRAVKSPGELALMRRAIDITARGFDAALRTLEPGLGEGALQRAIETAYAAAGGQGLAYGSIVGSGLAGTVLHYHANNAETPAGDLVVIDSGAKFGSYCADITRTLPVSGRFTREQRAVYDVVLMAQEAAIAAVRPGARMHEVDAAARSVIERAGLGDAFIHGVGHHLGLRVHDIDPRAPLAPGHVVTIEPGVYLPQRRLGIRIEDDILVTPRGRENLSKSIPKTVEEIEHAMAARGT